MLKMGYEYGKGNVFFVVVVVFKTSVVSFPCIKIYKEVVMCSYSSLSFSCPLRLRKDAGGSSRASHGSRPTQR